VCVLGAGGPDVPNAVAIGLAATAARAGRRVLLVGPAVPAAWSAVHRVEEPLQGKTWPSAPPGTRAEFANFALESVGTEFVHSGAFDDLLARASAARDLIVLGGGSNATATAWRMAEAANTTLVTVELGHDVFDDVLDLVESLHESNISDVAMVSVEPSSGSSTRRSSLARWRGPTNGSAAFSARPSGSAQPRTGTASSGRDDRLEAGSAADDGRSAGTPLVGRTLRGRARL
jgi:hypothetical protein